MASHMSASSTAPISKQGDQRSELGKQIHEAIQGLPDNSDKCDPIWNDATGLAHKIDELLRVLPEQANQQPRGHPPAEKSPAGQTPIRNSSTHGATTRKKPPQKEPRRREPSHRKPSHRTSFHGSHPGVLPSNRMPSHGMPSNEMPSNGMPSNGMPSNGVPFNGVPSHGVPSHWVPSNGMPSNGMPSNGIPSHGVPFNGMPSHGIPFNGMPSHGIPFNGMPSNGIPSHGTPPCGPAFYVAPSHMAPQPGTIRTSGSQDMYLSHGPQTNQHFQGLQCHPQMPWGPQVPNQTPQSHQPPHLPFGTTCTPQQGSSFQNRVGGPQAGLVGQAQSSHPPNGVQRINDAQHGSHRQQEDQDREAYRGQKSNSLHWQ